MMRYRCILIGSLLCYMLGIAACLTALAQREPMPNNPAEQEKKLVSGGEELEKAVSKRLREGTVFQGKRVFFRQAGLRTVLYTVDGLENYICLENLQLERILQAVAERPGRGVWNVDGEFTEFRGNNYVLIRRAVIAPPGAEIPRAAPSPGFHGRVTTGDAIRSVSPEKAP